MSAGAPLMIAGAEVRVDGQPLDPEVSGSLVEVRVEQHLMLPDVAVVRLSDPALKHVDSVFELGVILTVKLSAPESSNLLTAFQGRIAAVEPEFGRTGTVLAARAYDASHALNRVRRNATYQNMSADDIARKLASQAGLQLGTVDAAGSAQPFLQQHGETDLRLLWRLAAAIDFEVVVEDDKLHFRHAGGRPADPAVKLRWGEGLVTFRPRATAAGQVADVTVRGWDAASGQSVQATVSPPAPDSRIGLKRSSPNGNSSVVVPHAALDQAEAKSAARSIAARISNASIEAEGTATGDPRVRAGARVEVEGVGNRFGGTYSLTSVTHRFRGQRGYETHFTASGRDLRGLVGLLAQPPRSDLGTSLIVGVVTQTKDPDGLGRVRVKYPALGDDVEGWWARIASMGAGQERGALMLPQVGDEVVVGFEQGDARRPYVLGTLWNGGAKPGTELPQKDGSFVLRSDHRVALSAKDDVSIDGGRDLLIETDGKVTQTARGDIAVEGQKVSIKANGTLTVEAQDMALKASSIRLG